jgi:catechol 2,3-dioxygenase-like lactoylglutathione lyase family enzyme
MQFHHMCIVTTNLKEAIRLWRDVLDFELKVESEIPDAHLPNSITNTSAELLEDLYKVRGARSKLGVLVSPEGAIIELLEPQVPAVQKTPPENLRYGHSGFHELGLVTDDVDGMFKRVRAAGYKTQTEYVWNSSTFGRTFLFYDNDGNMIQLWEHGITQPTLLKPAAHAEQSAT